MKAKIGFSPWHTKQNSFEEEQANLPLAQCTINNHKSKDKISKKSEVKMSSRKKIPPQTENQSMIRSYSKTENFVTPFLDDNSALGLRKRVTRSSQKIDCERKQDQSGKKFEDQKWRVLAITGNDRFKNECAQLRKYQQITSQLKSRRSSLRPTPFTPPTQQRQKPTQPTLQQVSIKNFIIHGHYTDKDSIYQTSKRRDTSYVIKQKFASLKKTIECKENNQPVNGKKVIIVKGKQQQQQENLFKVIKMEREINSNNNNRIL